MGSRFRHGDARVPAAPDDADRARFDEVGYQTVSVSVVSEPGLSSLD